MIGPHPPLPGFNRPESASSLGHPNDWCESQFALLGERYFFHPRDKLAYGCLYLMAITIVYYCPIWAASWLVASFFLMTLSDCHWPWQRAAVANVTRDETSVLRLLHPDFRYESLEAWGVWQALRDHMQWWVRYTLVKDHDRIRTRRWKLLLPGALLLFTCCTCVGSKLMSFRKI